MIERLLVGGILVILLNIKYSNLVTIFVFLVFGLLVFIRRPYNNKIQNVRFVCNLLICIIVQVIYLIYKLSQVETHASNQIWIYLPLVICILLLLCIA